MSIILNILEALVMAVCLPLSGWRLRHCVGLIPTYRLKLRL